MDEYHGILQKYPNLSIWHKELLDYISKHKNFFIPLNLKDKSCEELFSLIKPHSKDAFLYMFDSEGNNKHGNDKHLINNGWVKSGKRYIGQEWRMTDHIYFDRNITPVISVMPSFLGDSDIYQYLDLPVIVSNPSSGSVKSAWSFSKKSSSNGDSLSIVKKNYTDPSIAICGSPDLLIPYYENLFLRMVEPKDLKLISNESYTVVIHIKFNGAKRRFGKSFQGVFDEFYEKLSSIAQDNNWGCASEATLYGTFWTDFDIRQLHIYDFVNAASDLLIEYDFPDETQVKTKWSDIKRDFNWKNLDESEFHEYMA